MRDALLLYNPVCRDPRARQKKLEAVARFFQQAGVRTQVESIATPQQAGAQARRAAEAGCHAVFACGGDGTLHDVAQGLVRAGDAARACALGVLPMGTGNILAKNLSIPRDPLNAARMLLHASPQRIAVGKIEYTAQDGAVHQRYFLLNAGAGLDARVMARARQWKARLGEAGYYLAGTRHLATYRFPQFEVTSGGEIFSACQMLAFRVPHLGGLIGAIAPAASLASDEMQVALIQNITRQRMLRVAARAALRRNWNSEDLRVFPAREVICRPLAAHADEPPHTTRNRNANRNRAEQDRIEVQADGEWLGYLPAKLTIVPHALTLLFPQRPGESASRGAKSTARMRE